MAQQVESHCPGFVVFLAEQIDPAQRMEIFFSVQLIQAAPELPDALIQKFRRYPTCSIVLWELDFVNRT